MAEEEEEATEAGSEEEGSSKKKIPLWLIILIPSQLVLIGGLVAVFLVLSGGDEPPPAEPTAAEQKVEPKAVTDVSTLIGPQFELEPFVVNLIDDGRGPRYLKTEIQFELEDEAVRVEVDGRLSQIRDEILMLLTSKRVTDVETPDGKRILKDEIFTRVNKILVTGRIKQVYFNEFVIQ